MKCWPFHKENQYLSIAGLNIYTTNCNQHKCNHSGYLPLYLVAQIKNYTDLCIRDKKQISVKILSKFLSLLKLVFMRKDIVSTREKNQDENLAWENSMSKTSTKDISNLDCVLKIAWKLEKNIFTTLLAVLQLSSHNKLWHFGLLKKYLSHN